MRTDLSGQWTRSTNETRVSCPLIYFLRRNFQRKLIMLELYFTELDTGRGKWANWGRRFQIYSCFDPLFTGHVIRRMRGQL